MYPTICGHSMLLITIAPVTISRKHIEHNGRRASGWLSPNDEPCNAIRWHVCILPQLQSSRMRQRLQDMGRPYGQLLQKVQQISSSIFRMKRTRSMKKKFLQVRKTIKNCAPEPPQEDINANFSTLCNVPTFNMDTAYMIAMPQTVNKF